MKNTLFLFTMVAGLIGCVAIVKCHHEPVTLENSELVSPRHCDVITASYLSEVKGLAAKEYSIAPSALSIGGVFADERGAVWVSPGELTGFIVVDDIDGVLVAYPNGTSPLAATVAYYREEWNFCQGANGDNIVNGSDLQDLLDQKLPFIVVDDIEGF